MIPTCSRANAQFANNSITCTLVENLRWGVVVGLFFACCYSLYVVGLYVLKGAAPFQANDTTLGRIVLTYFGIGIIAGALVGLLRPLLRWRIGAAVVGILVAFAAFIGFALEDQGGFAHWDERTWTSCFILAVLFGVPLAVMRWYRSRRPRY